MQEAKFKKIVYVINLHKAGCYEIKIHSTAYTSKRKTDKTDLFVLLVCENKGTNKNTSNGLRIKPIQNKMVIKMIIMQFCF